MNFNNILLLLFPLLLIALILFDHMIRFEHKFHHRIWEKDGKPLGFFWVPPELKIRKSIFPSFSSTRAGNKLALLWLFSTPDWAKRDRKIMNYFWFFRAVVLAESLLAINVLRLILFK
jgi:hypothetical protein